MSGVKRDVVLVEWEDSEGSSHWRDPNGIDPVPPRLISVGILVSRGPKSIILALSEDGRNKLVDGTMTIPKSAIRRTKRLARVELP